MDIIKLTRELGKAIQEDERYENYSAAKQASDLDTELQNLIGDFNLKRMAINNEASKADRDESKIAELNQELRMVYGSIMANERMAKYNESKEALDGLMQRVITILSGCAEGEDPETFDYDASACGGNCSSCGGCH